MIPTEMVLIQTLLSEDFIFIVKQLYLIFFLHKDLFFLAIIELLFDFIGVNMSSLQASQEVFHSIS